MHHCTQSLGLSPAHVSKGYLTYVCASSSSPKPFPSSDVENWVGSKLGTCVESLVGSSVGKVDGNCVGYEVGSGVGSSKPHMHASHTPQRSS
mmetsp:Transcript_48860/g.58934  ORF Transcript_48860/g.58934 Transcript_48860/m.58934 type:complete len:92 (-) Transcript_48860:272-547(-)